MLLIVLGASALSWPVHAQHVQLYPASNMAVKHSSEGALRCFGDLHARVQLLRAAAGTNVGLYLSVANVVNAFATVNAGQDTVVVHS
jgi:hypothetical protein